MYLYNISRHEAYIDIRIRAVQVCQFSSSKGMKKFMSELDNVAINPETLSSMNGGHET